MDQSSESLKSTRILRFTIHHSQLVGLPSLVAMGDCFYPDVIWLACTREVYPDGVVGVLNRALAIPNSRACRNSVVIGDWILSLKGTTWWNQRTFAVGNNSVFCSSFASETERGGYIRFTCSIDPEFTGICCCFAVTKEQAPSSS